MNARDDGGNVSVGGWVQFGTHSDREFCAYEGRLEFGPDGEDGLPDLERHDDGSECAATASVAFPAE